MFGIGDFARHGRVSVRMLRHYDAIGLLTPALVDPASGYRHYRAAQLGELNRILALRDLGFGLEQIGTLLRERVEVAELRGMLRLRRSELAAAVAADAARLSRVDARLRILEQEDAMSGQDVVVAALPAAHVAELSAVAAGFAPEEIGPVIRPLCGRLGRLLAESRIQPGGPMLAYYEPSAEDDTVLVHAAIPVPAAAAGDGLAFTELPAVAQAAVLVHHGSMDGVLASVDTMARWIDGNGYRMAGAFRELYLQVGEDESEWVTELQQPIIPVGAGRQ
jgi:DNA-binding transcriptional MerR regulator